MSDAALTETNRNPAVERTMAILNELERATGGLGLKTLASRAGVTRSSAYRILNSLEAHGMVRQIAGSAYVLGGRLIELGTAVSVTSRTYHLPRLLQPFLDRLATALGETVKISVYDRGIVIVIAGSAARTPHALNYTVGAELPLHAGGASKVLAASLSDEELDRVLPVPLPRLTGATITDRRLFAEELARVRAQGWAHDGGEYGTSVMSYAAGIRDEAGRVIAALSIPFLATEDDVLKARIRDAAVEATARMSALDLTGR